MGGGNESRIFSLFIDTKVSRFPTVDKFDLDRKQTEEQRIL